MSRGGEGGIDRFCRGDIGRQCLGIAQCRGDGGIEIPGFLKREYLAFIGEEDVDQSTFDQAAEIGAVALDAEGAAAIADPADKSLPASMDPRIQRFLRYFAYESPLGRPQDAWDMYKQVDNLRKEVFGKHEFVELIV